MKQILLGLMLAGLTACGVSNNNSSPLSAEARSGSTTVSFTAVKAGIEYTTDSQRPASLEGKKALVIASSQIPGGAKRVLVDSTAVLSSPVAGIDYPTDSHPAWIVGKSVLVLDASHRLLINLEQAKAGADGSKQ